MGELLILSALASALVQWLKNMPQTSNKVVTLAILVVVSFGIAVAVWLLQHYDLWAWFVGILATANLIYAFIIQHFESDGSGQSPLGAGFAG